MAQISSHLTIVMEPYIIFLSNLKRATKYATQIFVQEFSHLACIFVHI